MERTVHQPWIYIPQNHTLSKRALRRPIGNDMELVLGFEVWSFSWIAKGCNISQTGLLCRIDLENNFLRKDAENLLKLLEAESTLSIYIHGESPEHKPIAVEAEFVRYVFTDNSVELGFSITSSSDERLHAYYNQVEETLDHDISQN